MSFLLYNMPTELLELQAWLERHITGTELSTLVAELKLMGANNSESLQQMLGSQMDEVLESGLETLNREQVQRLLNSPDALLELQSEAFIHGSWYWQQIASRHSTGRRAEHIAHKVESFLSVLDITRKTHPGTSDGTDHEMPRVRTPKSNVKQDPSSRDQPKSSTSASLSPAQPERTKLKSHQEPLPPGKQLQREPTSVRPTSIKTKRYLSFSSLLAVCTCCVVGMLLFWVSQDDQRQIETKFATWGFGQPSALTVDSAEDHWPNLARQALQFLDDEPETFSELSSRLVTFRDGCKVLQQRLAKREEVPVITDSSREWLLEKCQKWEQKLDDLIVRSKLEDTEFANLMEETAATIKSMATVLAKGPPAASVNA